VAAEFVAQGMTDLRPGQAQILVPLLGGGRHASELAELFGVTRQAIAQVVGNLEGAGYVERIVDPGDARAKLVCLTARGRAALRAMRASALAVEDGWQNVLGVEDLAAFRSTLERLVNG
jgi:DNA-binding MarR family transcriptional regulator